MVVSFEARRVKVHPSNQQSVKCYLFFKDVDLPLDDLYGVIVGVAQVGHVVLVVLVAVGLGEARRVGRAGGHHAFGPLLGRWRVHVFLYWMKNVIFYKDSI